MASAREYSNNGSSTSSSSHQYDDVLESLHEIDNRSLGFAAGSSNALPHSHRPVLTDQKTGFRGLAREPSFDWTNFGGQNSIPELRLSHNVAGLRYGNGGGYFHGVKTNEEDDRTQQQAEGIPRFNNPGVSVHQGFSVNPVNGFGYSDQQPSGFGFI